MTFSLRKASAERAASSTAGHGRTGTAATQVAAVLLWVALGLACGEKSPERRAYLTAGCVRCHGVDARGTGQGPALTNLRENWTAASLDRFLADPETVRKKDPRLDAIARHFSMPMPRIVMPDSTRRLIVSYLLTDQ